MVVAARLTMELALASIHSLDQIAHQRTVIQNATLTEQLHVTIQMACATVNRGILEPSVRIRIALPLVSMAAHVITTMVFVFVLPESVVHAVKKLIAKSIVAYMESVIIALESVSALKDSQSKVTL